MHILTFVENLKLFHAGEVGIDRSKVRRRISPCEHHEDIEEEQRYSSIYFQLSDVDGGEWSKSPLVLITQHKQPLLHIGSETVSMKKIRRVIANAL
jgi:hypothetical protein